MDNQVMVLVVAVLGILIGAGIVVVLRKVSDDKKKQSAQVEVDRIINRAKSEAAKIQNDSKKRSKDFEARARKNAEQEIQKEKQRIKQAEKDINSQKNKLEKRERDKEEEFERKIRKLDDREQRVEVAEGRIEEATKKTESLHEELAQKLSSVASMTADQAKAELLKSLDEDARREANRRAVVIEKEAEKEAKKEANRILSMAISRYAGEFVVERTVSVVALPSDEMKGKIIGREGRNIRTLESLCGVDLIVDDTPEAVVISGFDPVRREIAKRTLEKLLEDGRVHPARIEEVVGKTRSDIFKSFREDGEKATYDLGLHNIHPELLKLIGSLKYRTSATLSNYHQAVEVGYLAGLIAVELGGSLKHARRAGLLHGIGKAIDHTVEGNYAQVGSDMARRHGEADVVCQAIRCHNGHFEPKTVIDHAVQAAFALSNSRPGARRHSTESYINRLEDLESIANSFDGVVKTFALQAGREVRVIVESRRVTDEQASMLSRDIARKIERELSYPGQVRINVVRETRAVEHAR